MFKWFKKKESKQEVQEVKTSYQFTIQVTLKPDKDVEEVSYEWDDDFIKFLRAKGYSGTSENLVVTKWLQVLLGKLANNLLVKSNTQSEFE